MVTGKPEQEKFWAGVILHDPKTGRVLMQKRDAYAPVNPNLWAFFGGAGEDKETPEDCVLREIEEELGVKIEKEKLVPLRRYFYERLETWRYVFTLSFDLEKSAMKLGEGESFDWIPLAEVLDYDLTDNTCSDLEFFIKQNEK